MMPSAAIKVESVDLSPLWKNYQPRSTVLFNAETKWYTPIAKETKGRPDPTSPSAKACLKDLAAKILQQEVQNYDKAEASGPKGRDVKFRQTVFSHGTSRDKVAAHVLRCMEAPLHSLSNLRALVALVTPKAKGTFEDILSSLTELFQTKFLPKGCLVQRFEYHNCASLAPLLKDRDKAERQLALWYYEDQLAAIYHRLIHQLSEVSKEEVEHNKMRAIRALVELLAANPRQNLSQILQVVANKLGDPARKVAAHAMYCLRTLLQRRPTLKSKVLAEVEVMLYRPNINTKAQYFGLCFLKDMIFKRGDEKVAAELVKLYFGFFKACTKKGEVDTRLMSALLRGLNRAFPYSGLGGAALEEQLGTLFKLCHLVNFNIATQALQLVYQVLCSTNEGQISDRFYQVLYRCLQDPLFGTAAGTTAFLNLVYKALSSDMSDPRTLAFCKRLLQVSQYQGPAVACGVLYLVSEVVKERPSLAHSLSTLLRAPPSGPGKLEDDLEVFPDVEDEDVKEDDLDENEDLDDEEEGDIKEGDLDKEEEGSEEKEVMRVKEEDMKDDETDVKQEQMDEEDDKNSDIIEIKKEEGDDDLNTTTVTTTEDTKPAFTTTSSWHHLLNPGGVGGGGVSHRVQYDPHHRNPLYCGAQYSSLWELGYLKAHFHPSVAVFASRVLEGQPVEYSGDPLQDFTLIRFLDRFVYRNPKKMASMRKDSAGGDVLGRRSQYMPQGARGIAVNTEEFSALEPHQVPEDEVFFHRYFTQFKAGVARKGVAGEAESDSDDSVDDDEFDTFLGQADGSGGGGDVDEELDEEMDFAAGAKPRGGRKGRKGKDNEGEGDNSDGDDNADDDDFEGGFGSDGEGDDDEMDFGDGDDDGFGGGGSGDDDDFGFDEETAAFSDDEFEEGPPKKKMKGNTAVGKKGKKQKQRWAEEGDGDKEGLGGMFASAESFAHLLEENEGAGDPGSGTSQALANRDRAHAKQLTWEVERDRKMKEQNWRGKRMGPRRGAGKGQGMGPRRGGGAGAKKMGAVGFKKSRGGAKRGGGNMRGKRGRKY
uniref:CCAAT-binding factor domain-containing protein n=1 Tax=Scylla olivacea TaxID=85551 RepID=A0A0P4WBJ8_SCYOL